MPAALDHAHTDASHHFANWLDGDVTVFMRPNSLCWICRQVRDADQKLAPSRLGDRHGHELEILFTEYAGRATLQTPLLVRGESHTFKASLVVVGSPQAMF